jgi:HrpA-like RNA helicase
VQVGLRMGQGVRDSSANCKITFVTAGYLVRLLSHLAHRATEITHLVIDEVHERSLDGDVLCLLARRLAQRHPNVRLILMSATLHSDLYQNYFSAVAYPESTSPESSRVSDDIKCLFVGTRRFPVEIMYLEDLQGGDSILIKGAVVECDKIASQNRSPSSDGICDMVTSLEFIEKQRKLALYIVRTVPDLGTAVLVFVAGIADIEYITQELDGLTRYKVVAIHSMIPYEDQQDCFLPAEPHEVKVILATNAAESSVTFPDVDTVVCLGQEKVIRYNSRIHRVELIQSMISQASAKQRAGRTGRVRPGIIFRLYTKKLHDKFPEHSPSEVLRTPLHDLICGLMAMLEDSADYEGVVPVLADLPQPPDLINVTNSFEFLYHNGIITQGDDDGRLTCGGRIISSLPVDIRLGRMIMYGVMLGIGQEICHVAAALVQAKTPFKMANPYHHKDANEFNTIVRESFLAMSKFDGGCYSEPIMMINLLRAWEKVPLKSRGHWCRKHSVQLFRMTRFASYAKELTRTVHAALSNAGLFKHKSLSDKARDNLIRLCITWSAEDNVLSMAKMSQKILQHFPGDVTFEGAPLQKIVAQIPENMTYAIYTGPKSYTLPIDLLPVPLVEILHLMVKFVSDCKFVLGSVIIESEKTGVQIFSCFQDSIDENDFASLDQFLDMTIAESTEYDDIKYVESLGEIAMQQSTLLKNLHRQVRDSCYMKITNTYLEVIAHFDVPGVQKMCAMIFDVQIPENSIRCSKLGKKKEGDFTVTFFDDSDQKGVNFVQPLITDTPLGVRLFNAYMIMRYER